LNHLQSLKKLEFDTCPKIIDYEKITDLPALETLDFTSCKIPSIQFITNIPSLKKMIMVGGSEVLDGDLKPILKVQDVHYANYKH